MRIIACLIGGVLVFDVMFVIWAAIRTSGVYNNEQEYRRMNNETGRSCDDNSREQDDNREQAGSDSNDLNSNS